MVSLSKKWLLLFLSTTLFACGSMREEIVPEQLTAQASKVVVDCFVSPQDTVLTAKVTRSRPVLDNNSSKQVEVTDAVVTLSDGSTSVKLAYNTQLAIYSVKAQKLAIRAGGLYTLTAQTPDGNQVSATTTIPVVVPLKTLTVDSTGTASQRNYDVVGMWQDLSNTYYRVKGSVRGIRKSAPANATYGSPATISFTTATNSPGMLASQSKAGNLSISASLGDGTFKNQYRSMQISMDLLHVDEAYYRYQVALNRQLRAADNPFAEAVIIPTNIQNGLGCFGSYNQSTMTIVLK